MPAYYLVDVREVKDSAKMQDYRARINPVVERFGGRFVLTGGPVQVVEGSYEPVFPVMIEFPSMEEYRELKGPQVIRHCIERVFHGRHSDKSVNRRA